MQRLPVRLAEPSDAAVLAAMLHAFNTEFEDPTPGEAVLEERVGRLLADGHVVALLSAEPPAGFALMSFRSIVWDPKPTTMLDELYVRPHLRGQGHGTAMLQRAYALARERGSETFEVLVDEEDVDARRFYERYGLVNNEPGKTERLLYYYRYL